jgi:hypothetical protein
LKGVEIMRYYVTNDDLIPFHEQPAEGYTKLQAIERAQREVKEAVKFYHLKSDYKGGYFRFGRQPIDIIPRNDKTPQNGV